MEVYENIFGIKFNYKTVTLLILLSFLPNLAGFVNFTVAGFKFHTFQIFVFMAAALYGAAGGIISGGFGSAYTAVAMNNPYIIIGNMILGGVTGFLVRRDWNLVKAAMTAYVVQMPWLWVSDIYWAGMPVPAVEKVVIALLFSDLVWSVIAAKLKDSVEKQIV